MTFCFGLRKLQKIQYTYLLPIPVDWIRNMNISKGDALKIEMAEDFSLRITPVTEGRQTKTETGAPTTA